MSVAVSASPTTTYDKGRYDRYPERGEGREYEGEADYQSGYRGGYADDPRYRGANSTVPHRV